MTHWFWIAFAAVVLGVLALDLGVFNRKAHTVTFRAAVAWTAVWVTLAMLFCAGVWRWHPRGGTAGLEFLTGYLVEESLSMDNVFVFLLILSYFAVPRQYEHKVLFWGVLGALLLRAVMILAGVALIQRFDWIIYVFGAFLVVTGAKLAFEKDKEIHPERNLVLRLFRRLMPVTRDYVGGKFFVRTAPPSPATGGEIAGRKRFWATPLFVVLLVIETSDVIFAVDSIPAVLGITQNTFIVYTSNVFAILGLRSLYFLLAGLMRLFHHLHYGLSAILVFIGAKMLVGHLITIPIGIALGVVAAVLALSVVASLVWPAKCPPADPGRDVTAGEQTPPP